MIERHDPFGRTMGLRQLMDRLLEDAFVMPRSTGSPATQAMNVYEEGNNVIVETQLPGMKPEDIDISVERGVLTIRGETKSEQERKDRNYLVREYQSGSFSRSIRLPGTVDADACQAMFEHGILRLTFPKSERARPRRIQIGSGGQQAIGGQGTTTGAPAAASAGASSGTTSQSGGSNSTPGGPGGPAGGGPGAGQSGTGGARRSGRSSGTGSSASRSTGASRSRGSTGKGGSS